MLFILFAVTVLLFGFVLLFGAPYLPTRRKESDVALDMLDLKSGDVLYELGCGDGRVLRRAAERGAKVVGYELNPLLVLVARLHTWKYRKQVRVIWANFWKADISQADAIFVFLLDKFMPKLDKKISHQIKKPVRLVSYAFVIPGKKILRTESGMHLYSYKPE